MAEFQTDALRPSSLPTASLGRRRYDTAPGTGSQTAVSEDLDKVAQEWNGRIDKEMKAMTTGLAELVDLADIGENPNPDTSQINALHLKLKTSQLIRSAQSIRDIAHELRLMLLLSDPVEEVTARDAEAKRVGDEVERGRQEVVQGVRRLLGATPGSTPSDVVRGTPTPVGARDGMELDNREEGGELDMGERSSAQDKDHEDEDDEDDGFEQVA